MLNLKRTVLVFSLVAAALVYAKAASICTTSSNPNENTGHCRLIADGFEVCFDNGEGPACRGTKEIE